MHISVDISPFSPSLHLAKYTHTKKKTEISVQMFVVVEFTVLAALFLLASRRNSFWKMFGLPLRSWTLRGLVGSVHHSLFCYTGWQRSLNSRLGLDQDLKLET